MLGLILALIAGSASLGVFLKLRAFNASSEDLSLWVVISVLGTGLAYYAPGLFIVLALTISAIALVFAWADQA